MEEGLDRPDARNGEPNIGVPVLLSSVIPFPAELATHTFPAPSNAVPTGIAMPPPEKGDPESGAPV
jgi:hypothetical protein